MKMSAGEYNIYIMRSIALQFTVSNCLRTNVDALPNTTLNDFTQEKTNNEIKQTKNTKQSKN